MRIRVAHVNQEGVDSELLFKHAALRKLAWITGTTQATPELTAVADELGYLAIFAADDPYWVAVRKDLVSPDTWIPNLQGDSIFAAFVSTPVGLGELVVASGHDIDAEGLADALGFDLVFHGGTQKDELGLGFFDRDGRVQKLKTNETRGDNYIESIITI